METSIFFAKLYGILFLVLGLLSLKTRFLGKTIERTDNTLFTVSTGYVSMLLGLVTVILHNVWIADWRGVITLLGWSSFLKGIMKTGFPELIHKQAQMFKNRQTASSIAITLLGAWLMWMGFHP